MENNPQGPENSEQARFAALEAQNAELTAQNEKLLGVIANLQADITAANDATVETLALLAKYQTQEKPEEKPEAQPAADKAEADTEVHEQVKAPVSKEDTPVKTRPVVVAPQRPATPYAGRPSKSEHSKRNRFVAVVAIGAVALGSFFAITRSGDKDKSNNANVPTQTSTTSEKSTTTSKDTGLTVPGFADGDFTDEKAAQDAAAKAKAENEAAAKAANKNNKSAHERALERAFDAKTVAGAVDRANPTSDTVKGDIRAFADHAGVDKLDHSDGKMSSALSHFAAKEMTSPEALLHTFDSALGSPAYAAKLYNELNGNHTSKTLPEGVSNAEALKSIEKKLIGADYQVRSDLSGLGLNHGQSIERGVYSANVMSLDGKEFLAITLDDGTEVLVKFENNCANIVDRVMKQKQVTPAAPGKPGKPTVTPGKPAAPGKPTVTPGKPGKPGKPVTPVTPGQPATPPTSPEQPNPKPKHDPNNTGKPGGQGGNGEETTRPQAGTPSMPGVGQEQQPLPPAETPQGGETTPTGPAETGTDPGTTGPAEQGGAGTTTPAGQINPGTTPAGE